MKLLAIRLCCPECGYDKHNTFFDTKKDVGIFSLKEDSTLYGIAGYYTFGVGIRKCKGCKKTYAVIFSKRFYDLYIHCHSKKLNSVEGKEVVRILKENKK